MEPASGSWSRDEHERFLVAIQKYPRGPWKKVADLVGTRTVRQTQTHAQKFREKLVRHERAALATAATPAFLDEAALAPLPYDASSTGLVLGSSPRDGVMLHTTVSDAASLPSLADVIANVDNAPSLTA
ncbi:hypothetical protein SPRG_13312 [Saprolegnia parasitica CBS 223.65]|uniref:Uncharacterized protein n=1 Tax=Saprolegnia parasitica (strain CBS 223.65) TaxID=695850 RepID=A0A067BV82_SAPPC|nr:hypothetical protein SPRG_13312 [Saprolegnia parasitica CBS 223.65]KDO20730.1 hypothetical protein SPRG_13312 [Saprolegnia parasitica CBS 223.65]|eukprot:XP_012208542.1 hypothetical protein SPRG_13312 [Saprolegnia parasitica CBS 223.65]